MSAIDPPEKKGRGCLFYGCLISLIGVVILLVAVLLIARYFINVANTKIAEYTETQPMAFPKTEISADDLKKLQQRVDTFYAAVNANSNTPPLVLTARDLNALIGASTNVEGLKDMCYVDIEGDTVKGELSLPLGKFFKLPFVHFKGRYLNGVGTFKVGVTNHVLSVRVESLEVKGKPLPPEFMSQLQGKNMADDYNENPTNAAAMSRFESIEVKDGKVTVKPKSP